MTTIQEGDLLLSKTGDYHRVLKVLGEGYVQSVHTHWSVQHNGEGKSLKRYLVFDGTKFIRTISEEELSKLYIERYDTRAGFLNALDELDAAVTFACNHNEELAESLHPYIIDDLKEYVSASWCGTPNSIKI